MLSCTLKTSLHNNDMSYLKRISGKDYRKKRNNCNKYKLKERENTHGGVLLSVKLTLPMGLFCVFLLKLFRSFLW